MDRSNTTETEQRTREGSIEDRQHVDRRGLNVVNNIIIPVVIAVIIGASASYIATQVTLSVVETKVKYIEKDIRKIADLMSAITNQNLIISKNKTTIDGILYRLNVIEDSISVLRIETKSKYAESDAERDSAYVERRIDQLQKQLMQLQTQLKGK